MEMKMIKYAGANEYEYVYNGVTDKYEMIQFERTYQVTEEEAKFLESISVEFMYNHMKQAVNTMTPLGTSKYIPPILFGGIEISLQINYQLWSLRYNNRRQDDDAPITKEEFDKLLDEDGCSAIDVRVLYKGKPFIKATTMCLAELELQLHNAVCDVDWD